MKLQSPKYPKIIWLFRGW